MHALGMATPADYVASGITTYGGTSFGGGYPTAFGGQANSFGAMGGGYVGGSWSPEPVGNNQILYGVYSGTGAVALPQAYYGQQATYNPATFGYTPTVTTQPTTLTQPTTTSTTTEGGGQTQPATTTPAVDPAKAAADKAAAEKAAAAKKAAAEKKETADKPEEKKTVSVKSGDTLSAIAAKHGTTWQKLYEANKGVIGGNPNLIKPGQELKIP